MSARTFSWVPGGGTIIATDPAAHAVELAAQRRDQEDRQIKTLLARAEEAALGRPPAPWELRARLEAINAARQRHLDEVADQQRALADLSSWAVDAQLQVLAKAPQPVPTRFGRPLSNAEQLHEAALAAEHAAGQKAVRAAGCGHCLPCRTEAGRCLYW